MSTCKPFDWPGLLGAGFFAGVVCELIGAIADWRPLVFVGVLLMVPLFLGIVFALSALVAEKVEGLAERLFGKGLLSKAVFWAVLVLIAVMFLFAGSAEYAGPRFWGSID